MNDSISAENLNTGAWRLLKGLRPRKMDLRRTELLRQADLSVLCNADRLERLLLELGLNDEGLHEFPEALHPYCGQGLLIWQFPNQFAPYLAELTRHRIDSYLEIGVRHGGSFLATVEIIRRINPYLRSVAIDIIPSPSLIEYAAAERGCEFHCINTMTDDFELLVRRLAPIDLVFIDSHHEESQCRHELARVRPYANIIALHDIANKGCPGISVVWGEIVASEEYHCQEFVQQYVAGPDQYMGIGLAIRKERLAR